MVEPSEEELTTLLGASEKQPSNLMGYFQIAAAKSAMISDKKKLLMLRVRAWVSANKGTIPHGVTIDGD